MGVLNQTQTTPQGFVDNHGHALVEGEEVYFSRCKVLPARLHAAPAGGILVQFSAARLAFRCCNAPGHTVATSWQNN